MGTDHIDIAYCRENNIQVMNCTGCNPETVAEHAISLVGPFFHFLSFLSISTSISLSLPDP